VPDIIDESLAWGRVVMPYTTTLASHKLAWHCGAMNSAGVWEVPYLTEVTVFDTCKQLTELLSDFLPAGTGFQPIVVYKNNLLPTPTEFWLTGDFVPATDTPDATVNAANTLTLNFRTVKNRVMKMVICDTNAGYPVPALVLPSAFVTVQSDLFDYIIANPNITTIDGEDIAVPYSITVTMNDTLSRRYGMKANTYE